MKSNTNSPAISPNAGGGLPVNFASWICPAVLAAITIGIYFQTWEFPFINYDDYSDVCNNQIVKQGITLEGIAQAFTVSQNNNWVPLTMLSHMLDCQLFGLNAGGHHLTNVLLHTASAVLLFLLLKKMTGRLWPSFFTAMVFAAHPLHVQSVAWIAERKDVLSGLFFMLTIWFYIDYARRRKDKIGHLIFFCMFVLGLMSKPMLITLPLILLLLDYWPLQRWQQVSPLQLLLEKTPLLLTSLLFGLVAVLAQGNAITPAETIPLIIRLGNALISCVAYIFQTFFPANLSIFYPYPENGLSGMQMAGSFILIIFISLVCFVNRKNKPYLLVGWLWFLIMLTPVIGIIQVGAQARADRYTYLPQIGLGLMLCWLAADWYSRFKKAKLYLTASAVLIILTFCSVSNSQLNYWRGTEFLFQRAIDCNPDNAVAEYVLGLAFEEKGRPEKALPHFENSVRLWPLSLTYRFNLGVALFQTGHTDAAILEFKKFMLFRPDTADIHAYLGAALFQKGEIRPAITQLCRAVLINPDYEPAKNELSCIAWKLSTSPDSNNKDTATAFKLANLADKLERGTNAPAAAALAAAYAANGRYVPALAAATKAYKLYLLQNNTAMIANVNLEIQSIKQKEPFRSSESLRSSLKNPF